MYTNQPPALGAPMPLPPCRCRVKATRLSHPGPFACGSGSPGRVRWTAYRPRPILGSYEPTGNGDQETRMERDVTPDRILQLGLGFWGPKVLLSAVELGVFTELARGPAGLATLTRRLGLH